MATTRGFTAFVLLLIAFQISTGELGIHSMGELTASIARHRLTDAQFSADMSWSTPDLKNQTIQTELADVTNHPVFGLSDVQSAVERVYLKTGTSYESHAHPRGSETIFVESGSLLTNLRFEGMQKQRVVRLTLSRGHVTVFPQGLPHSLTCASDAGCMYVSFFNTADPGLTAAPLFF